MRREGIVLDKNEVENVNACAKFGLMDKARIMKDYIRTMESPLDVVLGSSNANCWRIKFAREVFDKMPYKNGIAWSPTIEEGLEIFPLMEEKCGAFDLSCRLIWSGWELNQALELIKEMDINKDAGLWRALIRAYIIHGNVEIAEKAAKSFLELNSKKSKTLYFAVECILESQQMGNVVKIRELMTCRKIKKIPAWTLVEIDNKTHKIVVGDIQ